MKPQFPVVLLVDDEPDMRDLLRMYCETAGLQTVEARAKTNRIIPDCEGNVMWPGVGNQRAIFDWKLGKGYHFVC